MSDLVDYLRRIAESLDGADAYDDIVIACRNAADEIERLRAEVKQYKEMWAREFELRGDLAAMIERRMADASQDLRIRLRDAFDDLDARCNRQLRILAEDILDAVKQGGQGR